MTQYAYSENEEYFIDKRFFNSRQEAIDAGYEDQDTGRYYMVCEVKKVVPEKYVMSAANFLKIIESEAFRDVGKVSKSWLEYLSEVKQEQLRKKLQYAFFEWLHENKLQPDFYKAIHITYHVNKEKMNRDKE